MISQPQNLEFGNSETLKLNPRTTGEFQSLSGEFQSLSETQPTALSTGSEFQSFRDTERGNEFQSFRSQRWEPALEDDEPGVDVPRDWRWAAANLPADRWSRWRKYTGEFLASDDEPATVEGIKGAELAAFDMLRTDGGLA
jgi:hypothetical protein